MYLAWRCLCIRSHPEFCDTCPCPLPPAPTAAEGLHTIKLFFTSERTNLGPGLAPGLLLRPLSPCGSLPRPRLSDVPRESSVSVFPTPSCSLFVPTGEKPGRNHKGNLPGCHVPVPVTASGLEMS